MGEGGPSKMVDEVSGSLVQRELLNEVKLRDCLAERDRVATRQGTTEDGG